MLPVRVITLVFCVLIVSLLCEHHSDRQSSVVCSFERVLSAVFSA